MFQMFDVSDFEPLLQISFNSPSVEQDSIPSFGTLITCVNTCMRIIMKVCPGASVLILSLLPLSLLVALSPLRSVLSSSFVSICISQCHSVSPSQVHPRPMRSSDMTLCHPHKFTPPHRSSDMTLWVTLTSSPCPM